MLDQKNSVLRDCERWGRLNRRAFFCVIYIACSLVVSACIILPVPPKSGVVPPFFSEQTISSVCPGMSRLDVLMTLGNPELLTQDHSYFEYHWRETPYDLFFAGSIGIAGGAEVVPGPSEEHVLTLQFDGDGELTQTKEFFNRDRRALRADIQSWIEATAKPELLNKLLHLEPPGATTFIAKLPIPESPLSLAANASLRDMLQSSIIGDPATAEALVLVVSYKKHNIEVFPFFLLQGQDSAAFVRTILSMRPDKLLEARRAKEGDAPLNTLDYICVITADARLVELAYDTSRPEVWNSLRHSEITWGLKTEAINALHVGQLDYHGSFVCSLEKSAWPPQLRTKVTAFLDRVNVGSMDTTPAHQ